RRHTRSKRDWSSDVCSSDLGDDMILKRMKRRHLRADAVRFTDQVRRLRPDVVFGGDIIAGFPTESEEMFSRSLALVDECALTHRSEERRVGKESQSAVGSAR